MRFARGIARYLARRRPLLWAAAVTLTMGASAARAGKPSPPPETLSNLGLAFDATRTLPDSDRVATLQQLDGKVNTLLDGHVEDEQKAAAQFLSGEILFALGRYDEAREAFKSAEKEGDKTSLADDARLAANQALEASGKDEDADKEWVKWLKDNPDSPARADAMICRAWNAIRRDSLSLASDMLNQCTKQYPWTVKDPRADLASSTIAFMQKRYKDVTVQPSGSPLDAACVYLQALTDEATGNPLKAAAKYQEVATRYNDPRLGDVARLAKANVYLKSKAYKSAVEEFASVVDAVHDDGVRAEAKLRWAAATVLAGDMENGTERLRSVASQYDGSDIAARAQMVLGEALFQAGQHEDAIVAFNTVLTKYFQHGFAALAQYRVARCLDALGRSAEATGAYQAVVAGYPTSREAPAAAYMAGAGLLAQNKPKAAAPYFRLVLDRYAPSRGEGTIEFETPQKQELVEADLCLLELSYHRAGDLGLLSGIPHMLLQRMPPSKSPWRAYAMLIDADALAALGRHDEAQAMLTGLIQNFNLAKVAVPAYRLLAWSYSQQGKLDDAMKAEDTMLARYGSSGAAQDLSFAYLNKAHILFNQKSYKEAAKAYESFLTSFPQDKQRGLALYQAGMCYLRIGQDGDAVDRWESAVKVDPKAPIAEKALTRAGDVYFTAAHYEDAKRCYQTLLENFSDSHGAPVASLRIAQCDYNAGRYSEAVESFSKVMESFPNHPVVADARKGIEQSLYQLGQKKGGEDVLAQLIERFPSSSFAADAQFQIALHQYQAKNWDAAAEGFRRVVTQYPSYSSADRANYLMADSYSRAGKADEAEKAYEQFVTFFPNSEFTPTVQLQLGANRFANKDYMRAAVDFTSVLSDSTTPEIQSAARYNLALCQRMLGDAQKAQQMLEDYQKRYPNDERAGDVAYQLGTILQDASDFKGAATQYRHALGGKLTNDVEVEVQYRIGYCREQLGDIKLALADYNLAAHYAKKSNPYRLSALARSAALHEKNNEFGKALAAYRDLIKNATDPELVVAAKERASELEAAGSRR